MILKEVRWIHDRQYLKELIDGVNKEDSTSWYAYTWFRLKYNQWTNFDRIVKCRHYGLLRDRIKRHEHVDEPKDWELRNFVESNADNETFDLVYDKFKYFFKAQSKRLLSLSVRAGNTHFAHTMLRDLKVDNDLNNSLWSSAIASKSTDMIKFLLENGHIKIPDAEDDRSKFVEYIFQTHSKELIRFALDSACFPSEMSALVRSLAPKSYIIEVHVIGDQQLMDELIPADKLSNHTCVPRLSHRDQLAYNAPIEQHMEHIEFMLRHKLVCGGDMTDQQAYESLASSKEWARKIVVGESGTGTCTDTDTGSDENRLAIIKFFHFIKDRYTWTFDNIVNETLSKITKRDNGKVYKLFLRPHMSSHNSVLKLEVLKILNLHMLQLETHRRYLPFEGSMELLEFLVSSTNKVVQFKPLFTDINQLIYTLGRAPKLVNLEQQLQLALALGHRGMVEIIFKRGYKPSGHTWVFELTMSGRPQHSMFKWLMENYATITTSSLWERIGKCGDIEMVELAIQYYRETISKIPTTTLFLSYESRIKTILESAISENQTHIIVHIYTHHTSLITPDTYDLIRLLAIGSGNLRQLDTILGLTPMTLDLGNSVYDNAKGKKLVTAFEGIPVYSLIKACIFVPLGVALLECLLKHFNSQDLAHIKSIFLPLFTVDLVKNDNTTMLQYLLDIGATFQTKGSTQCTAYKNNQLIRSIFAQYKQGNNNNNNTNNKKRARDNDDE
ncbi:hypothetical protein SAMD00019534_004450 [Acytostelium subglobosum LB1]|uniref:hypothetical protein n=1 Tax=Acytostelium subglobosum LB1 TaxID=1410327 RepID=UPI000644C215|nr:hypothetical protein SAMD00019534_004450 [Acytostelium subglobosum LB1]GAM17270.1 hypothetical protein SAMD00019534_004450 [Acytostelium subglobosum LB1]|eukprot:XP_012759332.1 hypothetical protein SAMD00019534_004450 [Acytostelium subglobosum LB1]